MSLSFQKSFQRAIRAASRNRKKAAPASAPRMTGEQATHRIRYIIDDDEIAANDFEIRRSYAPFMTSQQIGDLVHELDRQIRSEKTRTVSGPFASEQARQRDRLVWKLNTVIRGLRASLADKREETKRQKSQEDLAVARATGKETCTCGARHPYGARFYVSAADAGRTVLLAGPFRTHAEALDALPRTRTRAEELDPRGLFYAYGTVAMSRSYTKPGILNSEIKP